MQLPCALAAAALSFSAQPSGPGFCGGWQFGTGFALTPFMAPRVGNNPQF